MCTRANPPASATVARRRGTLRVYGSRNNGPMTSARVLILHGYEHHRPREHWLWWLAEELRRRDIPVQYPQFPSPDAPQLDEWVDVATTELDMLGDGERIVVAHSLGTVLWLHLAAAGARATRVLL